MGAMQPTLAQLTGVAGGNTNSDPSTIDTNTIYDPTSQLTSFSSSPFSLAGIAPGTAPISTLDTGSMSQEKYQAATQSSFGDIINGLGNVVLGGIAISRIPSQNIGAVTSTQVAGRATGTTIVPANAVPTSTVTSLMPILLIGLVIVGVVLLAKKL